jgi:4-amino-4-deoxy-L-arabinose transferase-like glycosyltransferase
MLAKKTVFFLIFVVLGLLTRAGFTLAAGSREFTFHSGGSDAEAYVLLARNLISHKGFTYGGQPTAFRPPGYPLLVAGFLEVFGGHYITAIRWFQFLVGLLTVGVCAKISQRLFDSGAARATLIFGLFLPTLLFTTAQLLTECLAAFLTSLFLFFLVKQQEEFDVTSAYGLGLVAALESLVRFNAVALPLFAAWAVVRGRRTSLPLLRFAVVLLLPLLIALPWLVRNVTAFHGNVLYSTQTGANAVQGVINSQGRTQPGDTETLKAAMGWSLLDLETNDPRRLSLPSETELNRNALRVVPRLWTDRGWRVLPLLLRKIADFWLSTDQLLDTRSFPLRERMLRAAGVLAYLVALGFAIAGLYHLRNLRPALASIFIFYMIGFTLLHLGLVMNTRLRIPLMDPLIIVLAGAGWNAFYSWMRTVQSDRYQPRMVSVQP